MNVKKTISIVVVAFIAMLSVSALFIPKWRLREAYGEQIPFNQTTWAFDPEPNGQLSSRQRMILDLLTNVLRGKSRAEVEQLLGRSPTHQEMRRNTPEDMSVRERNSQGEWKPYPKTGKGHYWDELDWDLIYFIGYEYKPFRSDPSSRREMLVLRFDDKGMYSSWYMDGSEVWPLIVGSHALHSFSRSRL